MKKAISILYFCWIAISIIISGILASKFFPTYEDNEYPLFTDIGLLVFLPAFFVLAWLITHLANRVIKKLTFKIIVSSIILIAAFIYSIIIMEFSFLIAIILSFTGFVIGFIHYFITELIYRKSL